MSLSLKAVRVNAGLTQEEACKKIGISKSTLISYEKGKTKPTIELAKKMSEVYEMPIENISFL